MDSLFLSPVFHLVVILLVSTSPLGWLEPPVLFPSPQQVHPPPPHVQEFHHLGNFEKPIRSPASCDLLACSNEGRPSKGYTSGSSSNYATLTGGPSSRNALILIGCPEKLLAVWSRMLFGTARSGLGLGAPLIKFFFATSPVRFHSISGLPRQSSMLLWPVTPGFGSCSRYGLMLAGSTDLPSLKSTASLFPLAYEVGTIPIFPENRRKNLEGINSLGCETASKTQSLSKACHGWLRKSYHSRPCIPCVRYRGLSRRCS